MLIFFSPRYAYENAQKYWAITEKTHRDMSNSHFDYFYHKIIEVIKPNRNDSILDAGCGSGEITYAFHKDGYRIAGFDSSEKLIEIAKNSFKPEIFYIDDFLDINVKDCEYSKIFVNNAFFYIHPRLYNRVLRNFYDILVEGGRLYLLDDPDYEKRNNLYKERVKKTFTALLPIYDTNR